MRETAVIIANMPVESTTLRMFCSDSMLTVLVLALGSRWFEMVSREWKINKEGASYFRVYDPGYRVIKEKGLDNGKKLRDYLGSRV